MTGNSIGKLFKIMTFGESHGSSIGVVIDGCPSGLKLTSKEIDNELSKRIPSQPLVSPLKEVNVIKLSGVPTAYSCAG